MLLIYTKRKRGGTCVVYRLPLNPESRTLLNVSVLYVRVRGCLTTPDQKRTSPSLVEKQGWVYSSATSSIWGGTRSDTGLRLGRGPKQTSRLLTLVYSETLGLFVL